MEKYSGRCKCEKITFKIKGEPTWKVNCNCNWCQTTSGGAFRSFVLFNEEIHFFHLPELVTYFAAVNLSFLHIYNRKYCNCNVL